MESCKLKNNIPELNNSLEGWEGGLRSSFKTAEESISELEYRSIEMIYSEEKKNKENMNQSLREHGTSNIPM